ncbi:MAG: hypothetical protein ACOC4C_02435 [Fibrobacterota bacterium]
MTTVTFIAKQCFVCGQTSPQVEPGIRGIGQPDELDSRPGGVHRSSIYLFIQHCIHCGYCAPNINQGDKNVEEIVYSDDYQRILRAKDLPETAISFRCWSHIQHSYENLVDSGWATLFAAWVCDDDSRFKQAAADLRYDAYCLFVRSRSIDQPFADTKGDEEIILIDLLRRSNHFDKALDHIRGCIGQKWDVRIHQLLLFEQELCEEKDARPHLLSEALEDPE